MKNLKKLKRPVFSTSEANKAGISSRMLSYLVKKGTLERRAHGIYCIPNHPEDLDIVDIIKGMLVVVPDAIVGLETALQLYDLSDQPTRKIDLIIHQSNAASRKLKDAKYFRVRTPLAKFKVKNLNGIKVTTIEQTMVDLLRSGHSISELVRIFNLAQRKGMSVDLSNLKKIGDAFRAKGRVERFIEAVA